MPGTRIAILGGGFAGATLAAALQRRVPDDCRITIVSKENHITYNPLLAEVVGASILPGHVVAPLRQIARHAEVCMVPVTDIDLEERRLHYLGEGPGTIDYNHLVLACGVNANLQLVPGMARYALPMKTLGDALFIRNRILLRLEQASLQTNPRLRRWLTTFVVLGGGFSGVEVAGEIADFLRASLKYYPALKLEDCLVRLLHAGDRILPELSPSLSQFALKKMTRRGLDIRLHARAARIDAHSVQLQDGERVPGGTIIGTIGTTPNPLIESLPLLKDRGRVRTNPDLSVPGHPGLWALGDCAHVMNAWNDEPAPPTAQFATREATHLARNIAASLRGKETRPFDFKPLGALSTIGHHKAVAEVFGLRLSGFVAWLLWRGVYLLKVPTLARKVRVFFEWNWGMLFPADIAHLGFTRTRRTTTRQAPDSR
ncbi:MAG: NAD(P)/FAD-dependent oxidoreductase [Gammaproteobacteria bacterium]|nr:NAD(P)/FAD-dependent oxidoreductase [Gammaproteobacteria bacterium]